MWVGVPSYVHSSYSVFFEKVGPGGYTHLSRPLVSPTGVTTKYIHVRGVLNCLRFIIVRKYFISNLTVYVFLFLEFIGTLPGALESSQGRFANMEPCTPKSSY